MKFLKWILVFTVFNFTSVFSQENYTQHSVEKGESIFKIAKKYKIQPEAIYEINPEAKKGIKAKSILLIPNSEKIGAQSTAEITPAIATQKHEVLAKETLYAIAKQYNVSLSEIYEINPNLKGMTLKMGQIINIPTNISGNQKANIKSDIEPNKSEIVVKNEAPTTTLKFADSDDKKNFETISRTVLPKETKFGIAKEYGITVAELERQNPEIIKNLPVGFKLNISVSKNDEAKQASSKNEDSKKESLNDKVCLIENLIQTATERIGTRYRSGGTTKDGFDCSGLVFSTFEKYNITLPRSSFEQASYGEKIDISEAKKGDLIFFKTNGRSKINHVGMVVEVLDGEIKFIHSSNQKGVIVSSTEESYYAKNLVQVNRVL